MVGDGERSDAGKGVFSCFLLGVSYCRLYKDGKD